MALHRTCIYMYFWYMYRYVVGKRKWWSGAPFDPKQGKKKKTRMNPSADSWIPLCCAGWLGTAQGFCMTQEMCLPCLFLVWSEGSSLNFYTFFFKKKIIIIQTAEDGSSLWSNTWKEGGCSTSDGSWIPLSCADWIYFGGACSLRVCMIREMCLPSLFLSWIEGSSTLVTRVNLYL